MIIHRLIPVLTVLAVLTSTVRAVHSAEVPPLKTAAAEPSGPDRLVIVGDSTACVYERSMPYRGWGMYVPYYLKSTLEVMNLARPGRSVSTYMMEGSWKNALKEKPKFVLIQFGTNDARDQHSKEGVDAEVSFPMFLNKYLNAALSISAVPVLISPAHPRVFDNKGKLIDLLGTYEKAMRDVAKTRGVAMVDLYTASAELYEQLGEEASRQFEPIKNDHIHFNVLGAKTMAELVMRRLVKVEPRIVPYLGPDPMMLGNATETEAAK